MTVAPTSLDHVALWVDDREPLATFLCEHLGMHVIEETDDVHARRDRREARQADALRRRGTAPARRARARGPAGGRARLGAGDAAVRDHAPRRRRGGVRGSGRRAARPRGGGGRGVRPRPRGARPRPIPRPRRASWPPWASSAATDGCVAVGDRYVRIVRGNAADGQRPLLNHLALLVDDAHLVQPRRRARARDREVRTRRTRSRSSCAGPRASGSSTSSTSRASRWSERARPTSSWPGPGWPGSRPLPRRAGWAPSRGAGEAGAAGRLDAPLEWRDLAPSRLREFRAECPRGDERLQRLSSSAWTTTSNGWSRSGAPVVERDRQPADHRHALRPGRR